jgi:hypothetical protein
MFDIKKAMELKKKMDEITARLETITVQGEAGDGEHKVTATVTATRKIKGLEITDSLLQQADREYLQDLMVVALNRAMDKAQNVAEAEGRNVAMGGLFGM